MDFAFTDLLNSDWQDVRHHKPPTDRLDDPAWLSSLLGNWRLTPERPPGAAEVRKLKELRSLLRTMVTAILDGQDPSPADIGRLNEFLVRSPVVSRLVQVDAAAAAAAPGQPEGNAKAPAASPSTPAGGTNPAPRYRLETGPARHDWDWVLAGMALPFARILAEGSQARLKACDDPDCRWIFYDSSRGRTRRWCESSSCGNVSKVRRFRERHRRKKTSSGA